MRNNQRQFKKFKKVPLLMALGFLAFSGAAFAWTYREIKFIEADSHKAQAEWQAESNRRDAIRSLERSIREIESERQELETHFAESQNIVPFLDTLENLAQAAGAKAKIASVDIAKDKEELAVSMSAGGSFASVYRFVKLLENSPYELYIKSFDIVKGTGLEGGSGWEGRFTIHLLSFVK